VIPRAAGMVEASVCITLRRNDARCIICVARVRHLAVSFAVAKWHRRKKSEQRGNHLVVFSFFFSHVITSLLVEYIFYRRDVLSE